MKRLWISIVSFAFLFAPLASAGDGEVINMKGSFLRPLQERDSVLIADQLQYGFSLKGLKEGESLAFPDLSKGLMDSVEVLSPWIVDTVSVSKAKNPSDRLYDIEAKVVITSFDEGSYDLPPLSVLRESGGKIDTLLFDSQHLDVKTMPVDTATFEVHDIKGQIKYPVTFKELLPYIGGVLAICLLAALAVYLIRRHLSRANDGRTPDEPPHIIALRKLDKLRGSKYWAPEKQKVFYSGVTDAVREYMAARYGIDAMEMTTAEIFDALSDKGISKDLYDDMRTLFERSDFVKFAKYTATDDENAQAVPEAVKFVTSTYQSEIDKETAADGAENNEPEGGLNVKKG